MPRWPLPCLLLLACGGPPPLPDGDLVLRVRAGAETVAFGEAFPLTVTRAWKRDLVPEVWEDDALAPLRLELVRTTRGGDDARISETREYRAWAFERAGVALPAIPFRARPSAGGAEVGTASEPLSIGVETALDPEAPGEPELPGEPWGPPTPWGLWLGGGAVVLALLAIARRRPAPPPPPAPERAPSPADDARARLEALRRDEPADHDARQRWFGELDATLRAYLSARFGLDASVKSTEELIALVPRGEALAVVLAPCDLARYARVVLADADRVGLLDAAELYLQETA